MTRATAFCGLLLVALPACSSSSAAPPAPDAGVPDAARDAGTPADAGNPFVTPDSSGPGPTPDAGSACDELRAQVTTLQVLARACNPQGASECNAAIDGICCPISVSFDTGQAVDDFTQAVMTYKSQCSPNCTGILCGAAPTNVCIGGAGGSKGSCE